MLPIFQKEFVQELRGFSAGWGKIEGSALGADPAMLVPLVPAKEKRWFCTKQNHL